MKASIKTHRNEIRFIVMFILLFMAGQALHFLTRSYTTPIYVYFLNGKVSSLVINSITPGEQTVSEGPLISSASASISVEEGCEGIEGIILFVAAVLAFNASRKQKILGLLVGCAALYIANITRLISLYYVVRYKPAAFDFMHIFVGQTYIIFICVLLFISWTYYCIRET